eukprot:1158104-Pelagomonas_calceolata.AAC.3
MASARQPCKPCCRPCKVGTRKAKQQAESMTRGAAGCAGQHEADTHTHSHTQEGKTVKRVDASGKSVSRPLGRRMTVHVGKQKQFWGCRQFAYSLEE